MKWNTFQADKNRKKWSIRGKLWNGKFVKLSGHHDRKIADQMMRNIESLNRSRMFNELPDENLAGWINGLGDDESAKYIEIGLLPRRLLDKRRPIDELLVDFLKHLESSCEDRSLHPQETVNRVSRIFCAIGPDAKFDTLDEDQVKSALKNMVALGRRRKGLPISQKTKREYIFAIQRFCKWMVTKRGASVNPLMNLRAPSAKGATVHNRRPLEESTFFKLLAYLSTAPTVYKNQTFDWTPVDRSMLYQMAVETGFRANELRSLTKASVNFDHDPVLVTIEPEASKNRKRGTVPLRAKFANLLKQYSSHLLPIDRLLRIPTSNTLTLTFYRDLDAAEVLRVFADGAVIDFHTLRSTAICLWLKRDRHHLLDVQALARLETLSLVQDYVKNYVPNYTDLMDDRDPDKDGV